MWLGHRLATYFPIGKIVMCLASKLTSIYSQSGAPGSPHDRVDSLPGRRRFRFTQAVGQCSGFHKFCKDFPCDFVEMKQLEQESGAGHIGAQVPHFPSGRPSRCIPPRHPRHDAVNSSRRNCRRPVRWRFGCGRLGRRYRRCLGCAAFCWWSSPRAIHILFGKRLAPSAYSMRRGLTIVGS